MRIKYELRSKMGKANFRWGELFGVILDKFETLKASGKLFQMKRFVPKVIRDSFSDYLQFETDEDRILYQTLRGDENSGCNVLVYNDFYISGSTVREIASIFTLNQSIEYSDSIHISKTIGNIFSR